MASSGTIVARVYTSRAEIPIPGATVAVTQKSKNGRHTLLAIRISDESGNTSPIIIPTPDRSEGLAPGGETPYALCDLWIEASGFELLRVEEIQIFPGTETVQELELIPLPEYTPSQSRTEVVSITPQDL